MSRAFPLNVIDVINDDVVSYICKFKKKVKKLSMKNFQVILYKLA